MKIEKIVDIPENLSLEILRREFGIQAVSYYQNRVSERKAEGRVYHNPLKTIYIWATQDRKTHQGYYTSFRGYRSGRKHKNYGSS